MLRSLVLALPIGLVLAGGALAGPGAGDGDGHDHDADAHADEAPMHEVLRWSASLELFAEFPPLVAHAPVSFVIHLTELDGFRPVTEGTVQVVFTTPDGARFEVPARDQDEPGIYTARVGLPRAGRFTAVVIHEDADGRATFPVGAVEVHASPEAVHAHAASVAGSDAITFLKEQQWRIPFATAEVRVQEMKRTVRALGSVQPSPAAATEVTAPIAGVVPMADAGGMALPGQRVRAGDVVARIAPPLAGEGWAASRVALAQAERELARARRLHEVEAISSQQLERARDTYRVRKAGHERLAGSGDQDILTLTAPIGGLVLDWQVRPGRRLEAGDHLLTIADPDVVWLEVKVHEPHLHDLGTPVGVHLPGDRGRPGWTVPGSALRVLAVGEAIDARTRTAPVLFEVTGAGSRLPLGATLPVELHASDGTMATAVPDEAILEDQGLDVVFVQTGGETFVKRTVRLGPRFGGWVAVLDGVQAGERVVTRGGHFVKLAGSTAEIGHGHAH